ncbi:unnamed protein product, partial [Staurois parvus]
SVSPPKSQLWTFGKTPEKCSKRPNVTSPKSQTPEVTSPVNKEHVKNCVDEPLDVPSISTPCAESTKTGSDKGSDDPSVVVCDDVIEPEEINDDNECDIDYIPPSPTDSTLPSPPVL